MWTTYLTTIYCILYHATFVVYRQHIVLRDVHNRCLSGYNLRTLLCTSASARPLAINFTGKIYKVGSRVIRMTTIVYLLYF